jgi:hypothetical protein
MRVTRTSKCNKCNKVGEGLTGFPDDMDELDIDDPNPETQQWVIHNCWPCFLKVNPHYLDKYYSA